MKSHSQFTRYLQLQTDVHNEMKLLTIVFVSYRCLDMVVQKKKARDKNYYVSKRWECKVVLPDANSLFHTVHIINN